MIAGTLFQLAICYDEQWDATSVHSLLQESDRLFREESLALYREIGDRWAMGGVLYDLTREERAGYEQAVAAVRVQLGEEGFARAWAEGRTMSPEQVLAR